MGSHAQVVAYRSLYSGPSHTQWKAGTHPPLHVPLHAQDPHPCPTGLGAHRPAAPWHRARSGLARPHAAGEQACAHGHKQATDPHARRGAAAGWGTSVGQRVRTVVPSPRVRPCLLRPATGPAFTPWCRWPRVPEHPRMPRGGGGRQGHVRGEVEHSIPPQAPPPPSHSPAGPTAQQHRAARTAGFHPRTPDRRTRLTV